MPSREIDHGEVIEIRYTYLTPLDRPDRIVLIRTDREDVIQHEGAYFLRRHPDGQLCKFHTHNDLDEALSCTDQNQSDEIWTDFAGIVAEASIRIAVAERNSLARTIEDAPSVRRPNPALNKIRWSEKRRRERLPGLGRSQPRSTGPFSGPAGQSTSRRQSRS